MAWSCQNLWLCSKYIPSFRDVLDISWIKSNDGYEPKRIDYVVRDVQMFWHVFCKIYYLYQSKKYKTNLAFDIVKLV